MPLSKTTLSLGQTKKRRVITKPNQKQIQHACALAKKLRRQYRGAVCALNHHNPFELLVATLLSAQCTDKRVNQVTPALFATFPTPQALSQASLSQLERMVHSTGFYKNKAKHLKALGRMLTEQFNGQVPQTIEELVTLPGVGRKTANVILGNCFGVPGLVVDTHVTRLSHRMGLTLAKGAVPIERDLQLQVAKKDWTDFSHWMIAHGRNVCHARKPQCNKCILNTLCPRIGLP